MSEKEYMDVRKLVVYYLMHTELRTPLNVSRVYADVIRASLSLAKMTITLGLLRALQSPEKYIQLEPLLRRESGTC